MSISTMLPHIATIRPGFPIGGRAVGRICRQFRRYPIGCARFFETMNRTARRMITRQEAARRISERAARDPVFRHSLKIAPHATLEAMFGVDLPPDLEIEILQDKPQRLHIVLPENDMTDEALEAMAARISGWNERGRNGDAG
ncbi:hypothetical protein P7L79_01980 (plasmid) [Tistrella mobilis]